MKSAGDASKHAAHWIGGKPWDGTSERHGDIYNPATGQITGSVDFASPAEVDLAVAAAARAFPATVTHRACPRPR